MKVIKNDIKFNLFPIYIYIDGEKKGVVNFSKRTHINVEKGTHQLKLQCKIPFFSAEKTIEVEEQTVITFHNQSDKWLYLCLFDCLLVFLHFVLRLFALPNWLLFAMIFAPLIIGSFSEFINRKNFYVIKTKQKNNKNN